MRLYVIFVILKDIGNIIELNGNHWKVALKVPVFIALTNMKLPSYNQKEN